MATRGLEYWLLLRDGNFTSGMEKAKQKTMGLDGALNKVLRSTIALGGGAMALAGIRQYGMEAIQTTAKFEGYHNVLKFASRDMGEFAKNQQFLNDTIRDMKLPLQESYEGYSKLLSAMKNTPLESQARNIFKGVMTASTVLHLDSYRQGLVMFALQQMVSKGTVSSQELKQQLGESLPGAINLAADAMGMSLEKFNKALEKGDIQAIDFLPKFAQKLEEHFGKSLPEAINSMQAKLTEAQNKKLELKQELGVTIGPEYLKYLELQNKGLEGAMNMVKWTHKNKAALGSVIKAAGIYAATYLIINQRKRASLVLDNLTLRSELLKVAFTEARAKGLGKIKSMQEAYNVVLGRSLLLNPVFWIPAAIAGVATLYSKWEPFRKSVNATWNEAKNLKNLGQGIFEITSSSQFERQEGLEKLKLWWLNFKLQGAITGAERDAQLQEAINAEMRQKLSMSNNPEQLQELLELPKDFKIDERNIRWALQKAKKDFGYEGTLSQFGFKVDDKGQVISENSTGNSGLGGQSITESVGAGRQVRNVTVTINGGLVGELNVSTTHLQESADQIERKMKEILIRAIRDSEIAL